MPKRRSVTNGISQELVFGPVLFNIFVGDTDGGSTLSEGLVRWAGAALTKFNKNKCKVLHLSQGNPKYKYRLSEEWIESSSAEKDLGTLVDEKLSMSQQCAHLEPESQSYPGLHQKSMARRSREIIVPLYSAL